MKKIKGVRSNDELIKACQDFYAVAKKYEDTTLGSEDDYLNEVLRDTADKVSFLFHRLVSTA